MRQCGSDSSSLEFFWKIIKQAASNVKLLHWRRCTIGNRNQAVNLGDEKLTLKLLFLIRAIWLRINLLKKLTCLFKIGIK